MSRQLVAEAARRADESQRPASIPPSRTGWTAKEVGAYIMAPIVAVAASWAMRTPAPPPDAPARADMVEMQHKLDAMQAEVAAARTDCAVAREVSGVARSRAAGAEAVADSVASKQK